MQVVCVCERVVCESVVWDRNGCKSAVCVKELRVCVCVKEVFGTEVCEKVLSKNVLYAKVLYVQVLQPSATPATQSEGRCR